MFVSPAVTRHGIIALKEEIVRINALHDKYGDEWPPDFDPNDVLVFETILQELCVNDIHGYEEENWNSKPFRFFVELLLPYIINHSVDLSQNDKMALFRFYSEAHIKYCLQHIEDYSKSSPSFVDSEILKLGNAILKFPISTR